MPKHLAQGSTEPVIQPGKLGLYGMRFCPYDERVHLVMIAKNIPHENVFINLHDKPDWFLNKVPTGKVPALVVDGQILYESLIIADYLDEKYPEPPLHSKDPIQKAKDRIVIENFNKVSGAFYKLLFNPSPSKEDFEHLMAELEPFDKELANRGTKFFGGSVPGMVDYMIWPWFERISAGKLVFSTEFEIPESKFKHLGLWISLMKDHQTIKDYILKPEVQASYLKSYRNKTPDYNIPV